METGIVQWLQRQSIAAQSMTALMPKVPRWAAFLRRDFGYTRFPTGGMRWATGDHLLDNLLALCFLQSMKHRDKKREHELRNLIRELRPYHA